MAGTTTMGGGDTGHIQWTGGKSGERWSVVYALDHLEREPIYGTQRDFIDSVFDNPGNANPGPALALVALNLLNFGPDAPMQPGHAAYYPGEDVRDRFGYRPLESATSGPICGPAAGPPPQTNTNQQTN